MLLQPHSQLLPPAREHKHQTQSNLNITTQSGVSLVSSTAVGEMPVYYVVKMVTMVQTSNVTSTNIISEELAARTALHHVITFELIDQ